MQNDAIVKTLINSPEVKQHIATYFGLRKLKKLDCTQFSTGFSKVVWKISSPELPREFLIKEIRFPYPDAPEPHKMESTNATVTVEEAFYEFETIRKIRRVPDLTQPLTQRFPKNIGLFACAHPIYDRTTDEKLTDAQTVRLDAAKKRLVKEGEDGISLFIAEEIVKGRKPTDAEAAQAREIREKGMKTHPRIWLTVDTDPEDFLVKDDGNPVFYDVGDFKTMIPKEKKLLRLYVQSENSR